MLTIKLQPAFVQSAAYSSPAMQIDMSLLTRESSKYEFWCTDASDLGLRPGQFPREVQIGEHRLPLKEVQFDGTHLYRNGDANVALRIFND